MQSVSATVTLNTFAVFFLGGGRGAEKELYFRLEKHTGYTGADPVLVRKGTLTPSINHRAGLEVLLQENLNSRYAYMRFPSIWRAYFPYSINFQ